MQRRTLLRSGFREQQAPVWKIKRRQTARPRHLDASLAPVQAARNHQVQHQPQFIFQADGDALADSSQFANSFTVGIAQWGIHATKQERTRETNALQRLTEDALL